MANFFPRWSNWLPLKMLVIFAIIGTTATAGVWYYFTPKYTRVGYEPVQPINFPHDIHVSQLGMDCRYCHSFVEVAAHSNVPSTATCMNCHSQVQKDNPKFAALKASWETRAEKVTKPVDWVQIHKTPGYVYFNHAVHVNRGVSCKSCHGQVNNMAVVYQHEPHSMSWCLDCHRHPENHLRPREDVFNLDWKPEFVNTPAFIEKYGKPPGSEEKDFSGDVKLTQREIGGALKNRLGVRAPDTNCWGCHR